LLKDVPVDKVIDFQENFLTTLESRSPETLAIFKSGKLDKEATDFVTKLAGDLSSQYK